MHKKSRNYTPEEMVFILKRHLVDHVTVSDLCDESAQSSECATLFV